MSLFKGEDSVTQIDIACVDARLFASNHVILVNFNTLLNMSSGLCKHWYENRNFSEMQEFPKIEELQSETFLN